MVRLILSIGQSRMMLEFIAREKNCTISLMSQLNLDGYCLNIRLIKCVEYMTQFMPGSVTNQESPRKHTITFVKEMWNECNIYLGCQLVLILLLPIFSTNDVYLCWACRFARHIEVAVEEEAFTLWISGTSWTHGFTDHTRLGIKSFPEQT